MKVVKNCLKKIAIIMTCITFIAASNSTALAAESPTLQEMKNYLLTKTSHT